MKASFMQACINLALRGAGRAAPNPMVGSVVVKDGCMIARGFHRACGELHAERMALETAGPQAQGADLYVNLEPCSHTGRQPPCVEAIIAAGIARVFIGSLDPDPRVAGEGVRILKEAGIEVHVGLMKESCLALNRAYFQHKKTGLPFVTYKYAMTFDGIQKTALSSRDPRTRQLSGPKAARYVQILRQRHQAIMIGSGTLETDDPLLTNRSGLDEDVQPLRIIVGRRPEVFQGTRILATAQELPTLFATTAPLSACQELIAAGIDVWSYEGDGVPLDLLMADLGQRNIQSLLLEGGAGLASQLLQENLVQDLILLLSPLVWAQAPIPGPSSPDGSLAAAKSLSIQDICQLGGDLRIRAHIHS